MGERSFNSNLELNLATAKYRYARVFLDYLDAAKQLLEMQNSLPAIEPARELLNTGHYSGNDYREASIKMERILDSRRNTGRQAEGLEYVVGRFDIDLELAKTAESRCWEALVKAVNAVPKDENWGVGPWFGGSMSKQRDLLIADDYAADRIRCYQKKLSDTLYEYTPSPDSLEVDFRLSFGKLIYTVPLEK